MTETEFRAVLAELIEENPLAVRGVLKILDIEFTDAVNSLAVIAEKQLRLLVNLDFVAENCDTDEHVKALIIHEFLHVLLRHTDRCEPVTPADNLALDAVINSIIHRKFGSAYSSMMSIYYRYADMPVMLLRPMDIRDGLDANEWQKHLYSIWGALYDGLLCAEDILDIVDSIDDFEPVPPETWLGSHDMPVPNAALADAVDRSLRAIRAEEIWRDPKAAIAVNPYRTLVDASDAHIEKWKRAVYRILKRHLIPAPRTPREWTGETVARMPVLNSADRRGFARALWSPLLPDVAWAARARTAAGRAQVYLDVSGSMSREMPLIVALLARLSQYIRRPFWVFSDVVAPAVIRDGQLIADVVGGTSITCVLEHAAKTKPAAAVVVTDGFFEPVDRVLVARCRGTRLHAIVTRNGDPRLLEQAGIAYTQLARLPA